MLEKVKTMVAETPERNYMMNVIKRDGRRQPVNFNKITERLAALSVITPKLDVDPIPLAQKVISGLRADIRTSEIDLFAAETAMFMGTVETRYKTLAARILTSNLHKLTPGNFAQAMEKLHTLQHGGITSSLLEVARRNEQRIMDAIDYSRDYSYDFFGLKTLLRSYLMKVGDDIVERPQDMLMRVALGVQGDDVDAAIKMYTAMSLGYYTHATPTLFNSGTWKPQMSSCFLLQMVDDSIEGIYETLSRCARISKSAGGIGFTSHKIRCAGSRIKGTNGKSNGLVPMLRNFDTTAAYVDQGGGKRKGAFACYLEPWHADIEDWLDLKKNNGKDEVRARNLFYGLWVPDLFMKRVQANQMWSLMDPAACPGLIDSYGADFEALYEKYEREGRFVRQLSATTLMKKIAATQQETGTPYMLYKDSCNKKSNQANLGTIKSSNLCTEIIEFTSPDEIAVCNLASVALPKFVQKGDDGLFFNFKQFEECVGDIIRNLDKIIDVNYYPVEQARTSNMRHRPVGLGVQGLADVFCMLRMPFTSPEAQALNRDIFESMYYGACVASVELAEKKGSYPTFQGSPMSKGLFQFDLWGVTPKKPEWAALRERATKGMRNSLLCALMPTASTSQILGNNECFEPFTNNIYVRRTNAGEFPLINKHLVKDLQRLGLWNEEMRTEIIINRGSVQNISRIPPEVRELYKTVWELSAKELISMAAARAPYIDQSQSMNIYMAEPTIDRLVSAHFWGWKNGLKTGMYYLRTNPRLKAQQFTVDPSKLTKAAEETTNLVSQDKNAAKSKLSHSEEMEIVGEVCTMKEGCLTCSS